MTDPERDKQTVIAYLNTAFNDKQPAEAERTTAARTTYSTTPKLPMASRLSSSS